MLKQEVFQNDDITVVRVALPRLVQSLLQHLDNKFTSSLITGSLLLHSQPLSVHATTLT